ncbi:MAG: ectoine/hydroxyectoine ABC transporter substrate-binding protein EhuB [Trueperaceae bacterium]|jgi:polar amino acid transport system substrate-binding protein|nr:ectoine/hydroxyectoine ABC transporter substrate-binding protein EhuB [Truepera sp.]HRQ09911.1 ectoine/hydroxyectoine ABC transporter substrate-binding protein EhuB [Trueperaceae bacterium]
MKILRTPLLIVGMLAMLGFGFAQSTVDDYKANGITIATANEIPYGWVADGKAQGIAPDVATAVLDSMGITNIKWTVTDFGSLIPGLLAGRFDLVAASQAVLPARCEQVAFSKINSSYGEGFLVAAGNPKNIHSYDDFVKDSSLKLGIVSGADQLEFAQAYGLKENQIVPLNANADAPSALTAGRIDAYAATGLTVAGLADGNDRVEAAADFVDPVVDGEEVRSFGAFTFSKKNQDFLDAFNEALAAYQKTPEYRTTLESYGLTDHDVDAALAASTQDLCAGN